MKKIRLIIASLILVSPFAANAEEVTVTYEGEVTSTVGAGFGYAVGDPISGSFTFNTEDLVDVNGDGSYFESAGPVASNQGAVVEIYPENLDGVSIWNFEQNGYDQFSIGDATLQSGSPTSFTIWHAIAMWDFSELFDLENLPAGGLSFSDSDVEFLEGNIAHRVIDHVNRGYVEDQLAEFDITSLHIGVASTPTILLEQLEATVTGAGPGDSFANKIMLAQTYLEVPDEESACEVLRAFLNQVRAQRGKKLTEEQADQFTADAVAIMNAVGCD